MRGKFMLVIILSLVIATSLFSVYFLRFHGVTEPSALRFGSYMIYEQFFVWDGENRTDYMTWNVTGINEGLVDLSLTSHGVNATDGNVELTCGEANLTVNIDTRQVTSCSTGLYVGEKWPFWIETNVTTGSTVYIWYGINFVSKSERIYVLGRQRDCWVVEYDWISTSMKRWYDKSSGVCLKIHVILDQPERTIQIVETAVLTNIDLDLELSPSEHQT